MEAVGGVLSQYLINSPISQRLNRGGSISLDIPRFERPLATGVIVSPSLTFVPVADGDAAGLLLYRRFQFHHFHLFFR